jgi:hypothetical protein
MDNRKQISPGAAPGSGQQVRPLNSEWAESFDPSAPLPEYPRPSLSRKDWLSLNGPWKLSISRGDPESPCFEGTVIVPYPVESRLSGVERAILPGEVMRYRRNVELPPPWRGQRVVLHVGACDWDTRLFVNGLPAGRHRGGFVPFSVDITDLLGSKGEILIEVRDPTDAGVQCRGKQSLKPGGIYYTAASGIWGSVWLEPVPASHILRATALPDPETRSLAVEVTVAADPALSLLKVTARLKEGALVIAAAEALAAAGEGTGGTEAGEEARGLAARAIRTVRLDLPVLRPRLWSPESPFLYGLELELEGGDRAESYAAMRSVAAGTDAAGRKRVFLNGEPLFINAVLDQGYWPEGIYTAPSDAALLSDIRAAKALGFNAIRKHAKVERERWYWHCDREGVLVWQDIPSGGAPMDFLHSAILGFAGLRLRDDRRLSRFGRVDEAGRQDFLREAAEIVDWLRGFASVVAWVPFNEGWGQFESRKVAAAVAAMDPGRLVDAASGWYDRGGGHFASRHDYSTRPALPPRRKGRIAALSEFGGLTLKVEGHSTDDRRGFGYRRVADATELGKRYAALVSGRLARLARRGLAASVYTQITDVEAERNGLLTYDRRLFKADKEAIRAANMALARTARESALPKDGQR